MRPILFTILLFTFFLARGQEYTIESIKKSLPPDTARYANGNIATVRQWVNSTCIETEYYPSGQKKKMNISNDSNEYKSFGWVRLMEWCENGQLIRDFPIYSPKYGVKVLTYHCNGKIKEEFTLCIVSLTPAGDYKEYYESGTLKVDGHYEDPPKNRYIYYPKKINNWKYYDETGKLFKVEEYRLDSLVRTTEY